MDADIHLEQILTQAQRRIRLIDMATGGMVMVIFTFGFFFSEVLLDHFIILRRPYRLGLLVLYQVASIGLVLWLVLRPVFRRINQLFIAHRIEHQHPELKNRLVTYLQLDDETSPIIRHDISNNISRKLEGFAVPSVFSFKVLKPFAAAFIALSLLIYGYALLSQKSITVSLKRAIFPTQQILPPTLTKISRVEPGDADILKGNPVEFWAQTEGNSPETADLVYSMDGGTTWETMPMTVSGNGILKASMEAPEDTIRYLLAAGDTRSERYVVTVVNPPTLTSIRGELFFPAYTGLEKREFQGGTVKAIEGSRATIQGETNVPVNQAQVMLGNSKDHTTVRIASPQRITFDVAVHSNDIYRVLLTSTQGYKELNPPRHRIIALKDKPPEVRAIQPAQDVELAENESLELVFRMRDDFGLTSVNLRIKSRFEEERMLPLVVPDLTREKTANVRLPVKSLGLRAGDEATYSILVQDNKPDEPNAGESQTFGLRILDSMPVQLALNAPEESETINETDQTEEEASEEQGVQSSDEERAERNHSQADSESPANRAASTPDAENSNEVDTSDERTSQTDEENGQERAGDNERNNDQNDGESVEGQNSETNTAGETSTERNTEQPQSGTNSEDSQDGSTDAEGSQTASGQQPEANRTQSNDQNSGTQPGDSQQGEASDTATSGTSDNRQDSGTNSQPGQLAGAEEGTQPGQQQGQQTGGEPGQQAGSQAGQQAGSEPGSQVGQQAGSQPSSQSGQQTGSQPGQQAGSQPGSQPGQQAGSQPGNQAGSQAGENSQTGSTPSGSQPGQGEGAGASGQGSQSGSSQSGQSAGAQPGGQGSQTGSSQGQGSQSRAGQGAGSQGAGQNSQSGSQGSGSQAGGQSGSSQSGAQSGGQNSQGQGSSGQQASSSGQGSQGGSSTGSGSSSQGGNGGSGSPQAGNGSTSQPSQGEAQIARSSQAGAGRDAGEDKGSADPEINPDVFRQGGDGQPLEISSGGEDHLRDLKDIAALDENRLVELGFSKTAARQFARKLQELKLKEKKGQKDEELEKDLLEMAQSIALTKQKILKSEGVAADVSGSSVKAEYKADESAVVEAQLRNLPPQYREMVEEYFRSISSRKKDGEN